MACDERVGRNTVTYPCTLPSEHDGPHMSPDNVPSQGERRRWQEGEDARQTLANFQGPAQTTAQRYTDNATPVPVSAGRLRLHRDCLALTGCLVREHTECPKADWDATQADQANRDFSEMAEITPDPGPIEVRGEVEGSGPLTFTGTTSQIGPAHPAYVSARCGARQTMGHGSAVMCAEPEGHGGQHIEPDWYGKRYTWLNTESYGAATTHPTGLHSGFPSLPERERRLQEQREGRREVREEALKQRPGDQVLPTVNDAEDIQSQVIRDIEVRREVGISRYGTALQPFNGRDTLQDAYEEAMDLTVYLKSLLVMKDALREQLVHSVAAKMETMVGGMFQGLTGPKVAREMAEAAVDTILDAALLFEPGPVGG